MKNNSVSINFHPGAVEIEDIEQWLQDEYRSSGEGFFVNWNNIKSSYENKELAALIINGRANGFVTWYSSSELTARINILEIRPIFRMQGYGKMLIDRLLSFLKEKGYLVVDLACIDDVSERFWTSLKFKILPDFEESFQRVYKQIQLFSILTVPIDPGCVGQEEETLELWDKPPFRTTNLDPSWTWKLIYENGTNILVSPIIVPAHYDWRIRWKKANQVIFDNSIRKFSRLRIDHDKYLIIRTLTSEK